MQILQKFWNKETYIEEGIFVVFAIRIKAFFWKVKLEVNWYLSWVDSTGVTWCKISDPCARIIFPGFSYCTVSFATCSPRAIFSNANSLFIIEISRLPPTILLMSDSKITPVYATLSLLINNMMVIFSHMIMPLNNTILKMIIVLTNANDQRAP